MTSKGIGSPSGEVLELRKGDLIRFNELIIANLELDERTLMRLDAISRQVDTGAIEVNPTSMMGIYPMNDARYKLAVETRIMPGATITINDQGKENVKLVVDVRFDPSLSDLVIIFDDNSSLPQSTARSMGLKAD